MKKSILIFASLMLVIALSSFKSSSSKTSWLDGNWKGEKYQVNMQKAWKTELTIDTKSKTFTVSYPELNCKGYLVLESATKNQAIFIEKLDAGSCMSDGYIMINKVSEKLITFVCLRDNKTRLASFSTLEKQ
ncbi:MAG: hypothetical protein V4622_02890 [Bacteroidota bacterium]